MRISKIQLPSAIKYIAVAAPLLLGTPAKAIQNGLAQDTFTKTEELDTLVKHQLVSPEIVIGNDTIYPAVVINLAEKTIYQYDPDTNLENTFGIQNNSNSFEDTGLKKVSYISDYKDTAKGVSQVICLSEIGKITGKPIPGMNQLIIGTDKKNSLDSDFRRNNIIVDNQTIQMLVNVLHKGQYVLIKE